MQVIIEANQYEASVKFTARMKKEYYDKSYSVENFNGEWKGVQVRDAKVVYGEAEPLA